MSPTARRPYLVNSRGAAFISPELFGGPCCLVVAYLDGRLLANFWTPPFLMPPASLLSLAVTFDKFLTSPSPTSLHFSFNDFSQIRHLFSPPYLYHLFTTLAWV